MNTEEYPSICDICGRTIDELEPFQKFNFSKQEFLSQILANVSDFIANRKIDGVDTIQFEDSILGELIWLSWEKINKLHLIKRDWKGIRHQIQYECKDCYGVPINPWETGRVDCNLFWFNEDSNQYFEPIYDPEIGFVQQREVTTNEFFCALFEKDTIVIPWKKAPNLREGVYYEVIAGPPYYFVKRIKNKKG